MSKVSFDDGKHLKGYMFDSLVFRFKEYQAKALPTDVNELLAKGFTRDEAHKRAQSRHERDMMRFIQILDEAIGEHD